MIEEVPIGPVFEQKAFEQLGILVLDGSGSMADKGESGLSKADEVTRAVRDLLARLKSSRYRENFVLAITAYDEHQSVLLPPTPASTVDDTADYSPLKKHGGMTAIGGALEHAEALATAFVTARETNGPPRTAVLILMTDGRNNRGSDPFQVATRINAAESPIRICATGYGRDGDVDEATLKRIATEPAGYQRTQNPDDLRAFFLASVTQGRI